MRARAVRSHARRRGDGAGQRRPVRDVGHRRLDDAAGADQPSRRSQPPVAKRVRLPNGMAVLVVENHKLPIVSMSLVVPGAGTAYDPKDKPGVAAFTADMLDEGAGGLTAIQIAEEEDRLGAERSRSAPASMRRGSRSRRSPRRSTRRSICSRRSSASRRSTRADFERVAGDRATALELRRDRPREVAAHHARRARCSGVDRRTAIPAPACASRSSRSRSPICRAFYADALESGRDDARRRRRRRLGARSSTSSDAALGTWKAPGAKPARIKRRRRARPGAAPAARRSAERAAVRRPHRPRRHRSQGSRVTTRSRSWRTRSAAASRAGSTSGCASSSASRTASARAWIGGCQPGPFSISSAIVAAETATASPRRSRSSTASPRRTCPPPSSTRRSRT